MISVFNHANQLGMPKKLNLIYPVMKRMCY
ncbi:MAG: hypothetical protein K0Q95_1569 [Bacteroidota bacterium]|jgi:hypothetical protein|nr:hypothetical protein [Bacteroidota bacterium]